MKKIFLFFAMAMLIGACTPKPQPIDYGKEECAFCKMTIVSPQFASEVVTHKVALHLVCDYLNEGNFIEASPATYLVSPNIESPMGGNLAAFSSKEDAQRIQAEKGGDLYDWEGIQQKFQSHTPIHHNNDMHDH